MITNYGEKKPGKSRFVIIAPHASGDDLKTGLLAKKIAEQVEGFFVINKNFIKPKNSNSKKHPEKIEDFNKLRWSRYNNKYIWKKKKPEMRDFFSDIDNFCNQAKKYSKEKKAVAIYIHGVKTTKIAIDLGAGLKRHNLGNKLFGTKKHKTKANNSGTITLQIGKIKKIKKYLEENLNQEVTIGEFYSGWSKSSAIQFHKQEGRSDYALQFEINHLLRGSKKERIKIINLISQTLIKYL